jgi:hypothetical protein
MGIHSEADMVRTGYIEYGVARIRSLATTEYGVGEARKRMAAHLYCTLATRVAIQYLRSTIYIATMAFYEGSVTSLVPSVLRRLGQQKIKEAHPRFQCYDTKRTSTFSTELKLMIPSSIQHGMAWSIYE